MIKIELSRLRCEFVVLSACAGHFSAGSYSPPLRGFNGCKTALKCIKKAAAEGVSRSDGAANLLNRHGWHESRMTLAGEPDSCAATSERTDDDESALGEVGITLLVFLLKSLCLRV